MAYTNKALDKALETFASMMIEKMESIKTGWKKSWFTEGVTNLSLPQNTEGKYYNGGNSLMLLLACEKFGYSANVWGTFNKFEAMNRKDTPKEQRIRINKGEKAMPVYFPTKTFFNGAGEHISYDDLKAMSDEQRQDCKVINSVKVYPVFNIDQTNMKEVNPELYESYLGEPIEKPELKADGFHIACVDNMLAVQGWYCPIRLQYQDRAYWSVKEDYIMMPERSQFVSGDKFYGSLFHEMSHSTGHKDRLNREMKAAIFGDKSYAHEELIAELSAALTAQAYGMQSYIQEDSVPYLNAWIKTLKAKPAYIKNVLADVRKASSMITNRLDEYMTEQAQALTA